VTGGVISTTGIAGLTLGGGLGWLMGKHALALDNLLSVDLVLADGNAVTASNADNADLFWALRGVTASLPDEFTVFAGLIHAPDGSGTKLAAMVLCHCGALAAGERAAQPIKQFGAPVMDVIGAMPYSAINSMLDAAYPRGALNYWKSNFLASLSGEAIRTMIDCFAQCPTPMGQLLIEHFHGAVTRIGTTDTAFPHRAEGYNLLVLSEWMDTKDNDACTAWARNSYAAMQPFMSSNRYVNYLADDERGDAVAASYGPNYRRLQQLKAKYDPENFFHMNHNIRPVP
jgi:FAD/FMN-containing dehydrogenase